MRMRRSHRAGASALLQCTFTKTAWATSRRTTSGLTDASEESLFSDKADAVAKPKLHGCAEGLDTRCTEIESAALRTPDTVDKLVLVQDRKVETFTQGGGKRRLPQTGPATDEYS